MLENPFFNARAPEMSRRSFEEKRRSIRQTYERGQRTGHWPVMGSLKGDGGQSMEHVTEMAPGQILIEHSRDDDGRIQTVETDRGLIVIGKHVEMMTKELAGCQAVFVHGKTMSGDALTGLFHLTPSSGLPWGNFKHQEDDERFGHVFRQGTVERIVSALRSAQANPALCTVHFIRNAGGPPETKFYWGYDERHLETKTHDLEDLFTSSGYATHVVEALPLQSTTLYWSSDAPAEMFAIGERRVSGAKGGFEEPPKDQRGVEEKILLLNAR